MSQKIANTKRSGLSVSRVERNRLDTLYYQLQDILGEYKNDSGSDFSASPDSFFARPKDVPSEKSIDWYSDLSGKVTALSDLPPDEALKVQANYGQMVQSLKVFADKLQASGDRTGAELLRNALTIPDASYIYLVGDQIVITCWGFSHSESTRAKDGELSDTFTRNRVEESPELHDTVRQSKTGDSLGDDVKVTLSESYTAPRKPEPEKTSIKADESELQRSSEVKTEPQMDTKTDVKPDTKPETSQTPRPEQPVQQVVRNNSGWWKIPVALACIAACIGMGILAWKYLAKKSENPQVVELSSNSNTSDAKKFDERSTASQNNNVDISREQSDSSQTLVTDSRTSVEISKEQSDSSQINVADSQTSAAANLSVNPVAAPDIDINRENPGQLSLTDGKLQSLNKNDKPLVVPEYGSKGPGFAEGKWKFDKDLIDEKGRKVKAEFEFDKFGNGSVLLINSDNEKFAADAHASFEGDKFRVQTAAPKNESGNQAYMPLFLECENQNDSAVCKGTDGWNSWNNLQLVADDKTAKDNSADTSGKNNSNAKNQRNNSDSNVNPDEKFTFNENDTNEQGVTELDGGTELPPTVMNDAKKAVVTDANRANPLEGNWRFSQDFARKSDGSNVGLEFHFDKDGTGYSLIRDKSSGDSKADAVVIPQDNGNYRVKTSPYSGNKSYYPTFMECKTANSSEKELRCDVSNGWMHLDDGVLLSLDSLPPSYRNNSGYEDLQPADNKDSSDNSAHAESSTEDLLADMSEEFNSNDQGSDSADQKQLSGENSAPEESMEDMLADLSESLEKSQPKETSAPNQNLQKPGEALAIPQNAKSADFLEGAWICKTGLVSSSYNKPIQQHFLFNRQGKGYLSVIDSKKNVYYASAQARLKKNGRLVINTSEARSKTSPRVFSGIYYECSSNKGKAVCNGANKRGNHLEDPFDATFIKTK